MGLADLVTPVAATDGDDGQFRQDDGTADGSGHFLAALDAQTDVSVVVSDGCGTKSTKPTGQSILG